MFLALSGCGDQSKNFLWGGEGQTSSCMNKSAQQAGGGFMWKTHSHQSVLASLHRRSQRFYRINRTVYTMVIVPSSVGFILMLKSKIINNLLITKQYYVTKRNAWRLHRQKIEASVLNSLQVRVCDLNSNLPPPKYPPSPTHTKTTRPYFTYYSWEKHDEYRTRK